MHKKKRGFSLIELVVTVGILILVGLVISVNLSGKRSETELRTTTQRMASLLREAQSRSVSVVSSSAWGVHFNNVSTSTPYYSLFHTATYTTQTELGRYRLPISLRYTSSTVGEGSSKTVAFAQITGFTATNTSIGIELLPGQLPSGSITNATITINMFGVVDY